jgi:hypothetical protein
MAMEPPSSELKTVAEGERTEKWPAEKKKIAA